MIGHSDRNNTRATPTVPCLWSFLLLPGPHHFTLFLCCGPLSHTPLFLRPLGLTLVCPGGADEPGLTLGMDLLHSSSHLEISQLTREGQAGGFALWREPHVFEDNGISQSWTLPVWG